MKRRTFLAAAAASAVSGLHIAGAQTPEATLSVDSREITHALGTVTIPANPERVLALGEEFLLADLLELGIKPIGSSANYADRYVGIDPALTEGLEPFVLWEADIEALIQMQPDLVLIPESILAFAPEIYDAMSQFAPVVPLPDNVDWQADFVFLASIFGKETEADALLTALNLEIDEARASLALEGQTVTIATVYEGGTDITLWLTDRSQWVELAARIGLTVVPAADDFEVDQLGRAAVSLEQANLVSGDTLIMPQSSPDLGPNEQVSLDEVVGSDLWQTVSAVQNDRVFTVERVGYPGDVPGRRSLLHTYIEIFGTA